MLYLSLNFLKVNFIVLNGYLFSLEIETSYYWDENKEYILNEYRSSGEWNCIKFNLKFYW